MPVKVGSLKTLRSIRAQAGWALPVALLAPLALAACSRNKEGPKTPVFGQRTSILSGAEVVKADETLANTPVLVPDPEVNADWAQSGGDAAKLVGHLALGDGTTRVWTASIAGGSARTKLASPPVIAGGKLFVIDTEAVVRSYDAKTGQLAWTKSVRSDDDKGKVEFGGGVSVEGDRLYASTGIGDVVAMNAADGTVVWKTRPGGPLRGSPTISNGNIYVMSQDNQLFAMSETDGNVVWQDSGTVQSTGVFGVAAPAAGQGSVIAGYSSGELSAYRYENGRVLWGDALSRTNISTSVSTLTDIDADPVIDRGNVFAIGEGGRMAAYDLKSGQRLWELNIGGIATPRVVGEWVFVVTDKARLFCITRSTGKVRWIAQLPAFRNEKDKKGPIRWYGPVLAGGRLILVSTDGGMSQVTPGTGAVQSKQDLHEAMSLPPVVADNMLYVLTENGHVLAFR